MLLGCSSVTIAKHPSLSCASGERVRVAGNGSCWLYAVLASLSLLDHAAPAVENPSEVDYSLSQWLLAETQVHVLTHVELFPRAICALSVTTTCSNMGVHFCAIIMLAKSVAPSHLCRAKLTLACSARSSQKSTAPTKIEKLESLLRLTAASKQKHGSVLHVASPNPRLCSSAHITAA